MELRRALARDIHRSGVSDPDLLAQYLIERGWVLHKPWLHSDDRGPQTFEDIHMNEIAIVQNPFDFSDEEKRGLRARLEEGQRRLSNG